MAAKKLLTTGVRVALDVAKEEKVEASLKRRFKDAGMELLNDTLNLVSPPAKKKRQKETFLPMQSRPQKVNVR